MEVAEASRETEWEKPSFVGDLFLGKSQSRSDPSLPRAAGRGQSRTATTSSAASSASWPRTSMPTRSTSRANTTTRCSTDSNELGAWGMKIPKEYGGLGFSADELQPRHRPRRHVVRIDAWRGSPRISRSAFRSRSSFSARPSRRRSICRACAKGAISAFALTEPGVGSDPAKMETTAGQVCRTARAGSSTARSSGARTARRPSCSW